MAKDRKYARELASQFIKKGEPLSWFDKLYKEGKADWSLIPWADLKPNQNIVDWLGTAKFHIPTGSCLVVGCGLGDDAEFLSGIGFAVDSFDISPTAIEVCQERFNGSSVRYFVDDVTDFKGKDKYDFVFEAYTLQVLPHDLREKAIRLLPDLLKENGCLLVICRARDKNEDEGNMPWPLTVDDFTALEGQLECICFEDYFDKYEDQEVRRFRILYRKRTLPNVVSGNGR